MKTSLLVVASLCVGLSALPACGAGSSREKVSLAYPGSDARDVSDHLSQAITDAGMSPNCKDRNFCKFKFNEQGTVHYKLLKRDPVLLLEIADDVPEEERGNMFHSSTGLTGVAGCAASGAHRWARPVTAAEPRIRAGPASRPPKRP